jgi:hypothetical protein
VGGTGLAVGSSTGRSLTRTVWVFSVFLATPRPALADGVEGPALAAWLPTYNQNIPEVSVHGSGCHSLAERMPAGRESACGKPELTALGTGRYRIDVSNAAPFPVVENDSGTLTFVTTVGSNAHCFDEGTTVSNDALSSLVRCVAPDTGDDVDSELSWSYRADSLDFPQRGDYAPNFAYARVTRDGVARLEESFNPVDVATDDVLVRRNGEGDYTVVFKGLNPLDGSLDPVHAPYSVIVQKTCDSDTAGGADTDGCFRAVCVPSEWTPGDFTTWDTTITVRCSAQSGSPRDTGFRVFFGGESHTSQGSWDGGYRYGWANWNTDASMTGCFGSPEVVGTSQHETPPEHYPGQPIEACRSSVGTYELDFLGGDIGPYSVDGMTPIVSARSEDGAYCNAERLECGAAFAVCALPSGPEATRITIGCFDRTGDRADVRWNLNMTY